MAQNYDNPIKHIMLGHAQELAEFIVGHSNVKVLENLGTEQPTLKTHRTDSTLKVQLRDETVILHTEMQTDDSRKPMWARLAGYNGFLINQHEKPVYCNAWYLRPNAGRNDKGYYAYKGMGYEYVLRYKVIRLITIEGQPILEKQVPGLLPFTPLMKPPQGMDSTRWLEQCIDVTACASIDESTRDTLLAALGIFGSLVYEPSLIKQRLPEGIMQNSPFFQEYAKEMTEMTEKAKQESFREGIEEGIEEGIKRGEKRVAIQGIMDLLQHQFQPDAVEILKPTLESIDDPQRLRELLLVARQVESLERFMQVLANGTTESDF